VASPPRRSRCKPSRGSFRCSLLDSSGWFTGKTLVKYCGVGGEWLTLEKDIGRIRSVYLFEMSQQNITKISEEQSNLESIISNLKAAELCLARLHTNSLEDKKNEQYVFLIGENSTALHEAKNSHARDVSFGESKKNIYGKRFNCRIPTNETTEILIRTFFIDLRRFV